MKMIQHEIHVKKQNGMLISRQTHEVLSDLVGDS